MTWHPVLDQLSPLLAEELDQLSPLPAEELGQIEIRASKALAFLTGPNEAPITVLSLVAEVRRLREQLERKEKLEAAALGTAKANWDDAQHARTNLREVCEKILDEVYATTTDNIPTAEAHAQNLLTTQERIVAHVRGALKAL